MRGAPLGNKNALDGNGGAPQKLIPDDATLKTLGSLAKIHCTTKEAAAVLGVSEPTFIEFLKRYEKAREVFDDGKEQGKASLRRMQFKNAESGNTAMQIWLGKQYLEQRDKNELTGKDGEAIQHRHAIEVMIVDSVDQNSDGGPEEA